MINFNLKIINIHDAKGCIKTHLFFIVEFHIDSNPLMKVKQIVFNLLFFSVEKKCEVRT